MKDLLQEIKYNRSIINFNHKLDNLINSYYHETINYEYNSEVVFYKNKSCIDVIIDCNDISFYCGLDIKTIFNIIDKRFNNRKKQMMLNGIPFKNCYSW